MKELIATSPDISRRALSLKVCADWGWTQPNGVRCDALCRSLLLELHRAGHISLPPSRWGDRPPLPRMKRLEPVDLPQDPIVAPLRELGPLEIRQVRRTKDELLVHRLVAQHHYLGYTRPVGEHLEYLITARGGPIACFVWSSAARHLGPRDRFIGWSKATRKANIRLVAYQVRFLILPWIHVPHLASHLLGAMARRLAADWQHVYAHPVYFTETFVDPTRFRGTCYRAANWTYLGMTTGRGKDDQTNRPNRSLKQVFGYPLVRDFRRRLEGAT